MEGRRRRRHPCADRRTVQPHDGLVRPDGGRRLLAPCILFDVVYAPERRYAPRVLYDIGSTTIAETPSYHQSYSTWSIQFVYGR